MRMAMGLWPCAKVLEEAGADYLGVGNVDEGIALRKSGVKMPILIFASNLIQETASLYVEYDLMPTILSLDAAKAFSEKANKPSKIFVKIDTGRGRIGVNAEEFGALFREIKKLPNLSVEGVYSHMAAADWPDRGAAYAMCSTAVLRRRWRELERMRFPFASWRIRRAASRSQRSA